MTSAIEFYRDSVDPPGLTDDKCELRIAKCASLRDVIARAAVSRLCVVGGTAKFLSSDEFEKHITASCGYELYLICKCVYNNYN